MRTAQHLLYGARRRARPIATLTAVTMWAFGSLLMLAAAPRHAQAQDMLQFLDLKSDEFTKADMTRTDVEALITARKPGQPLDLPAKRLNGLDLSGLDLAGANLQSTRINGTNLKGTILDGAVLDQAWGLNADLTGASLQGASLFSTQLMGARIDGANFSKARVAADFSRASLKGARFDGADLSADMKNQSMGLMRGVFRSSDLTGAAFPNANLARVVLDYARLQGANLSNANLAGSEMSGADLTGANVAGADFTGADVTSARLLKLVGREHAKGLDRLLNRERAFTD